METLVPLAGLQMSVPRRLCSALSLAGRSCSIQASNPAVLGRLHCQALMAYRLTTGRPAPRRWYKPGF